MRLYIKLIWGRGASRSHGKARVWNNKKLLNQRDRKPREENTRQKSGDSSMTASTAAAATAAAVEINLPRLRASAASMHLGKTQHLVTFYSISSLNTHAIALHIVFYRTVAEALLKMWGRKSESSEKRFTTTAFYTVWDKHDTALGGAMLHFGEHKHNSGFLKSGSNFIKHFDG